MGHIDRITLAQLVDEAASPELSARLQECECCREELAQLKRQTEALSNLPDIVPPPGGWRVLEARLQEEGVLARPGYALPWRHRVRAGLETLGRGGLAAAAAVAVAIFLVGAVAGTRLAPDAGAVTERMASPSPRELAALSTPEEALQALQAAERRYVLLRTRLAELVRDQTGGSPRSDSYSRFAALEHLAAASRAAVRQAPEDPYLNGLFVSVMGEREATARLVSARQGLY